MNGPDPCEDDCDLEVERYLAELDDRAWDRDLQEDEAVRLADPGTRP